MTKILLKIKNLRLKKYNTASNIVYIEIGYMENEKLIVVKKIYLQNSSLLFAKNLLN